MSSYIQMDSKRIIKACNKAIADIDESRQENIRKIEEEHRMRGWWQRNMKDNGFDDCIELSVAKARYEKQRAICVSMIILCGGSTIVNVSREDYAAFASYLD